MHGKIGAPFICLLFLLQTATAGEPMEDAVFRGIVQRLELMKAVAAWKLANNMPVEDLERESLVLQAAAAAAKAEGLEPQSTLPFFQAQIDAAKDIQWCWQALWNTGLAQPEDAPDLVNEIRPRLLEIGARQLTDIKEALASGIEFDPSDAATFESIVVVDCFSDEARDRAVAQLIKVRLLP